MAYVLSFPSNNPRERPFAEALYMRSCSSLQSHLSSGTVRCFHQPARSPAWPLPEVPQNLASRIAVTRMLDYDLDRSVVGRPSVGSALSDISRRYDEPPSHTEGMNEDNTSGNVDESFLDKLVDGIEPLHLPEPTVNTFSDATSGLASTESPPPHSSPFRKWLSTLRKRHDEGPAARGTTQWLDGASSNRSSHQKSASFSSSTGFLTAVKSASLTLAGTSVAPASRHGNKPHIHSDANSGSFRGARLSTDSATGSIEPSVDGKAWFRSIQRRNIVDEILNSEESYISDMKAMIHVYSTLLVSTPAMSSRRRESIQRSISQIIQLHQDLLAELQLSVPMRVTAVNQLSLRRQHCRSKHTRWHSADTGHVQSKGTVNRQRIQSSVDMSRSSSSISRSMTVSTNVVLNVAKVFDRFMRRFLAYEAYVAHHNILLEEVATTSRLVPAWSAYERGVEALNVSTTAIEQRDLCSRKGLTFSDLAIKPIQRICKYPLFFADLRKQTPACDDPIAHAELEKVLSRLRETAEEINQAMDNLQKRHLIESTWLLQDRFAFRNEHGKAAKIEDLGHVILCGALHIAYESSEKVKGHYGIGVLYRSWLVLATVATSSGSYLLDAIIPLFTASIDEPDNGRGLQCHTAPHTWKLVFSHQQKYFELIMSACSEQEETAWKDQIQQRITAEAHDLTEGRYVAIGGSSYLALDVKPESTAFEAHGPTRHLSIRRAATLGPKTQLQQVIIKNTFVRIPGQLEVEDQVRVIRSKSYMSSTHPPTLAPRRSERVRLEGILADVWSRDILPYPGMAVRRPENAIRASANSVMRKLSMASIASNFSKRSASFNGLNYERSEDSRAPSQRTFYNSATRSRRVEKRRSRAVIVDFHSAPAAFLPEDFELKKSTLTTRGQNFVKRAMTMEGYKVPQQVQVPLPGTMPMHGRVASAAVSVDLQAPASAPLQSEDRWHSSSKTPETAMKINLPAQCPSLLLLTRPEKGHVKVKGKLFKLFGIKD